MTSENMKHFFEEARYRSWEEFERCTTFEPTTPYDICLEKLNTVLCCFESDSHHAWDFFEAIYEDLPTQYRIPLMLETVYQNYKVDYGTIAGYISNYIFHETPEMREQRIAANQKSLAEYLNADGTITLYRGVAEGTLLPECAVSYTVDKAVAEHFVEYHKERHHKRFGGVYTRTIDISQVLYYSNSRKEQEVFIIPDGLDEVAWIDKEELGFWTVGFGYCKEHFPTEYAEFSAENDVMQELEQELESEQLSEYGV